MSFGSLSDWKCDAIADLLEGHDTLQDLGGLGDSDLVEYDIY